VSAKILVVEDNPTNLKLVSDVLGFEGYHILQAKDAEQAQAVIARTPPDLILMDLALPGMDGLMLTRKLKAQASTKAIPIIAVTAFAMKGDEEKALAFGCDGYLTKPIDTRKLLHRVAHWLAHPRPKRDAVETAPSGPLPSIARRFKGGASIVACRCDRGALAGWAPRVT
jgi:CheY-like chemotaxis protein